MHRYGIEDETWFEAARTGLERLGFTLRVRPRAIVVERQGRLPRRLHTALTFLEFVQGQGVPVEPAALEAAERYGAAQTASPFDLPQEAQAHDVPVSDGGTHGPAAGLRGPDVLSVERHLAELRLEQARLTADRQAAEALAQAKRALESQCAALQAEVVRLNAVTRAAIRQRDAWRDSAASAEEQLRLRQVPPAPGQADSARFQELRRFLARELHPDLAGADGPERAIRETLFKRVWAKVEELQHP